MNQTRRRDFDLTEKYFEGSLGLDDSRAPSHSPFYPFQKEKIIK